MGEPLAYAEGELPPPPIGRRGQVDEVEHLIDSGRADFAEHCLDAEMVPGSSPRVGLGGIENGAYGVQRLVQLLVAAPVDGCAALGGAGEAEQHAQGRRLPGPIRTEEADHLT